jgi:hypothetical protein
MSPQHKSVYQDAADFYGWSGSDQGDTEIGHVSAVVGEVDPYLHVVEDTYLVADVNHVQSEADYYYSPQKTRSSKPVVYHHEARINSVWT